MALGYFAPDIGVDLGTVSIQIHVKNKGVVLNEPMVIALDSYDGRMIAIGAEAEQMFGRTPHNIQALRPLYAGVIADYNLTVKMLGYFLAKAYRNYKLFKPRLMVCAPSGVTGIEERAVRQAALEAGARGCYIMEEPLAAALGAELAIEEPGGKMIVDIGGGTTDIAVISLGCIVGSKSLRLGGSRFDEAIMRYLRQNFQLLIGERYAEQIKIAVGNAYPEALKKPRCVEVRGRDLVSGLPRSLIIDSNQCFAAIKDPLHTIVAAIFEVLENTPPELAADLLDTGILLTGGGALLPGLDALLSQEVSLPVYVAADPITCVARGAGKALAQVDDKWGRIYVKK